MVKNDTKFWVFGNRLMGMMINSQASQNKAHEVRRDPNKVSTDAFFFQEFHSDIEKHFLLEGESRLSRLSHLKCLLDLRDHLRKGN